ncbi:hypothetical protein PHYPSEUDO_009472 [Phytophthora pseudosyringae]|uniref:Uncharacterized protein n=1 Tax=Phytophthora pseudosyringae TaxID=221518 RepID=A0A8T1VF76_9STRA|nr:hypothetical protein PHYPSEUDO_009472 [Phytophthora pseudosyringae]
MVETSPSECAIRIVEAEEKVPARPGAEFKPLTSGQLLLKTRHKADQRALLGDLADDEDHDEEDPGRECFLSRFLAASMTLLVGGFVYFVVLQHWLLKR